MAGGEPRLGTTATYMRHNDHGTTRLSIEIDRLHDRINNEYRVFSAGSVRKWSKFGLAVCPQFLRTAPESQVDRQSANCPLTLTEPHARKRRWQNKVSLCEARRDEGAQ